MISSSLELAVGLHRDRCSSRQNTKTSLDVSNFHLGLERVRQLIRCLEISMPDLPLAMTASGIGIVPVGGAAFGLAAGAVLAAGND